MLTAENTLVKTWLKHTEALKAVQSPKKVAVIHCRVTNGGTEAIKGSNKVDANAKRVALEPVTWQQLLIP